MIFIINYYEKYHEIFTEGIQFIEYTSTPHRQVRTGYVPPKPEWSDEKKNQWNKIQAMLGRYPGNEQYKISCSTAVESIKSSRSCSFYLGTDSEATPYGPFSGYGSGKRANLTPRDTTAWSGVKWR